LMNDPELNKASPVVAQLIKAGLSPEKAIEQLYLTVLSRRPSAHELKVMSGYLSRHPDAARGYAGVQWILLNTPEFVLIR
jgi:hypothetical protein